MVTASETQERIDREKDFHNKTFGSETRQTVLKFYEVVGSSWRHYEGRLKELCAGKRVLEYGCGPGSYAFMMAELEADVTGIDISETAIHLALRRSPNSLSGSACFCVMDAESLGFPDREFDLVCGRAILHHLDLTRSLREIVRVLKPRGTAVFVEPLGHNPLINLYRKRTPHLRTPDEHPLLMTDLAKIKASFPKVRFHYFHCLSLASVLMRNLPGHSNCLRFLDVLDQVMFRVLPFSRRFAWTVVIEVSASNTE